MSFIIIVLMLGFWLADDSCVVAENLPDPSTTIFIQSRFMLWDTNEKMLDNNFTVNIFHVNSTTNNTGYYEVEAGNGYFNGSFQNYITVNINYTGSDRMLLSVKVDNITYLSSQVIIVSGMDGDKIRYAQEPYTISLNPLAWSRFQWNIFYAIATAVLLSIFIGYRIVKRYKSYRGVVIIT